MIRQMMFQIPTIGPPILQDLALRILILMQIRQKQQLIMSKLQMEYAQFLLLIVFFVEVFTIPIISLQDDTTVCEGEIVTLGNTILEPGVDYNWTPNIGLDFNTIPNPTATINSTQTYTLSAVNGACVITESVTVISTVISINIQDPDSITICKGEEVNISAAASPFGTQITWTPDDGTINPTTGENVIVAPQTTTTYYAYVSVPGCEKFDSIYIDVDSIPQDLQILPSDTMVCAGSLVVLQTTTYEQFLFPNIQHQWQPNIGFQSADSLVNMVIEAVETTLYTRTTTNGVCTQVDSALITIFTPTSIEITPLDTVICVGESVQMLASSPDVTEFEWSPDDNTLSCLECPDPIATPTSTSNYTVYGEFEDCPVEASVQIEVAPNPVAGVIADTDLCIGESIILNDLVDGYPGTTWNWIADPSDPTLNPPNVPEPEVTPLTTTTYTLTVSNGICDPLVDEVTITILNNAVLTIMDDATICQADGVTLTASSTEPGTFIWTNNINNETLEGESVTANPDTSSIYTVTFMNDCDTLSESVNIEVIPAVNVTIEVDPNPQDSTLNEGQEITLTAVLDGPLNSPVFTWNTGQTGQTITAIATNPSNFSVTVTSADGCSDTDSESFEVDPAEFAIPNVFTPDGDGENDYFNVSSKGLITIREFKVFNRWGKIVYDNDDPVNGWDGRYKNELAPSDVYIYTITIDMPSGEVKNESGDLTLLR